MPYRRKSIGLTLLEYAVCMAFGVAVGVIAVLAVCQ
jgi:hypothetical protein